MHCASPTTETPLKLHSEGPRDLWVCALRLTGELPSSITDVTGPENHKCALAEIGRIRRRFPHSTLDVGEKLIRLIQK